MVEVKEPDKIGHQFFFEKSKTKCIVHETYMNPETVFAHFEGVAPNTVLPRIHDICRITRFEVFRTISNKLRKAIEDLNLQTSILFTGFNRLIR